ncbi:MAG TPA: Cj0069 family protein [Polyangiaceae bacterium]|nr:Cj0069 family protein [Polyangiaceae bacterium]
MTNGVPSQVAILYPGDRAARDRSDPAASRFAPLFSALGSAGLTAEPAVYHDDFVQEVEAQLGRVRIVLVWHNPIEGGRTRRVLDAMLRRVASRGVLVHTHPDTILRMGTKDVLVEVRDLPFGSDSYRVDSPEELNASLTIRLALGPRVLKQHRGHSGIGVWLVEQLGPDRYRLRHAQRGSQPEVGPFPLVLERLTPYFAAGGHMIDQAFQPRLREGMVRAYLVRDRVAGFGHQAINALYPAQHGESPPEPGPRLYSAGDDPRFQLLRRRLEDEWVDMLRERLGVAACRLPVLWDADFLLGGAEGATEPHYVLCEINVSSVAPYPESATIEIVDAVRALLADSGSNPRAKL